jgi:hypothetical protein
MANQKIRNSPDGNDRETGRTSGWHEAVQPNQSDMNRGRETRAEPSISNREEVT